jgi:hypothetical protein
MLIWSLKLGRSFLGERSVDGGDDFSKDRFDITFSVDLSQLGGILDENLVGVFPESGDSCLQGFFVIVGTLFRRGSSTLQDASNKCFLEGDL